MSTRPSKKTDTSSNKHQCEEKACKLIILDLTYWQVTTLPSQSDIRWQQMIKQSEQAGGTKMTTTN